LGGQLCGPPQPTHQPGKWLSRYVVTWDINWGCFVTKILRTFLSHSWYMTLPFSFSLILSPKNVWLRVHHMKVLNIFMVVKYFTGKFRSHQFRNWNIQSPASSSPEK
jgi:hypothetical protein